MKKKAAIGILVFLTLLLYGIHWAFFDIQRMEGQKVLSSTTSPDGAYTVTAYRNDGGATTDYAVLCTVRVEETGRERNIYWQYRQEDVTMEWIDNDTIRIGRQVLDLPYGTYDYRHAKE